MENLTEDYEEFRRTEDINAPVSWCCVDCGINTAPGLMTKAEIYKAFVVEGRESVEVNIDWKESTPSATPCGHGLA